MAYPAYVTVALVRDQLQDRSPEDNAIDNDLFWSDEDIIHAMDRAAAAYNAIPPLGVHRVVGHAMPADTNVFLYGTLAQLYEIAINKLSRNIMDWSAGDTKVDLEKPRIEAFSSLRKVYDDMFRTMAVDYKSERNRSLAWGMM